MDRIRNLTYADFLAKTYDVKQYELSHKMYDQALSMCLQSINYFDDKTLAMLLWILLMDNKGLIVQTNNNNPTIDFYNTNKILIDYCIEKILRETKPILGKIIYTTGWRHVPDNPYIIDMHNTLVWMLFGDGINMTCWALINSNKDTIAKDITEYCKDDSIAFVLKR